MHSREIREKFINFFKKKGHKTEKYIPLLLKNDPTLMFVNSGMVQFKDIFMDNKNIDYSRVVNFQKCLRVCGKHNDLEDVGKDTYHHTLFEMLGNWSFGDYFKKEAIEWAWEFLTEEYKISKEDLYVTIFEGSKDDNIDFDEESYEIWKNLIPEDRIIRGNKKDNFWEMGSQGPCGPSSEIHIDIRDIKEKQNISGKELINKDHPQVIEIWNIVFIQYNRKADGRLELLSKKHVDTGMGFERLVSILQGKKSNYDTDLFLPIIDEIEKISNKKYNNSDEKINIAIRVIADHLKAVGFSISEGIIPSNNREGYVIRRILRRAIRYGYSFLDIREPFIYRLYDTLKDIYGDYYSEIKTQEELVKSIIFREEEVFLRTLESGLKRLENIISHGDQIDGEKIFELYDTYGFPPDLTSLILSENNILIDEVGFKKEMEKQRNRSKKSSEITMEDWIVIKDRNDTEFIGYDYFECDTNIIKYRKFKRKDKELYQIVLEKTPFYSEGGGQIGDIGFFENSKGERIEIIETKKENGLIIHISENIFSNLNITVKAKIDIKKRNLCNANHSATHLLHHVLRNIFGKHIEQKGSFVSDKYLRFDFSHYQKIDNATLKQIENQINILIREELPLQEKRHANYEEELKNGVIALFEDKYNDNVRSIRFGGSYELCGGTHVNNTKEIKVLKIMSESSVASGIRRIEAVTSYTAIDILMKNNEELDMIREKLDNAKNIYLRIEQLKKENDEFAKAVDKIHKDTMKVIKNKLKERIEKIGNINFIVSNDEINSKYVKDLCFGLSNIIENMVLVVTNQEYNKSLISIYVSKNLVIDKVLDANKIIREIEPIIDGKGGGQPFFSVANVNNIAGIDMAINKIKESISNVNNNK